MAYGAIMGQKPDLSEIEQNIQNLQNDTADLEDKVGKTIGNAYELDPSYTNGAVYCYNTTSHLGAISYDNVYALSDGTAPALVIDGQSISLLKRSQFDYETTINLDNIRAGVYWINGYSSTIAGNTPFTNTHYMLISTGNNSNTMQIAINTASGHEIKMRYRANNGAWNSWS